MIVIVMKWCSEWRRTWRITWRRSGTAMDPDEEAMPLLSGDDEGDGASDVEEEVISQTVRLLHGP